MYCVPRKPCRKGGTPLARLAFLGLEAEAILERFGRDLADVNEDLVIEPLPEPMRRSLRQA
jgi:hypothetical protein